MSVEAYTNPTVAVNSVDAAIIPPQPGEFVASLLAAGHIEDARACQLAQYREGCRRALYGQPVSDFHPTAMQAGYNDTVLDMLAEVLQ